MYYITSCQLYHVHIVIILLHFWSDFFFRFPSKLIQTWISCFYSIFIARGNFVQHSSSYTCKFLPWLYRFYQRYAVSRMIWFSFVKFHKLNILFGFQTTGLLQRKINVFACTVKFENTALYRCWIADSTSHGQTNRKVFRGHSYLVLYLVLKTRLC